MHPFNKWIVTNQFKYPIKFSWFYLYAEYKDTKHSHISEYMCFDVCHSSWWLLRIQNWLDWISTTYRVIYIIIFQYPFSIYIFGIFKLINNNFFSCFNDNRYFPFGVDGTVAGSATAFLAYIGFDAVACTAEEV